MINSFGRDGIVNCLSSEPSLRAFASIATNVAEVMTNWTL